MKYNRQADTKYMLKKYSPKNYTYFTIIYMF
jgi:hypothetical protein